MGDFWDMGNTLNDAGRTVKNLWGDVTGSNQTENAVNAQAEATAAANATQKYMYDTTRKDLEPWRQAGTVALGDLGNPEFQKDFNAGDSQADPGYQFRLDEGMKALQNSSAVKSGRSGTATLKAISRYGQDFASNEFTNAYNRFNADKDRRFNRLSSIAGIGQTAQGQTTNAATNYGNSVSSNQISMGNAIGSANIAQSNRNAGLMGNGIMGGAMVMASDKRLKTNIEQISKEDLDELKSTLKPYKFNYISDEFGEGDWIGVMAQDLEKSKLGKSLVCHDENGHKFIDLKKLACLFLATLAEG